MLGGGNRRLTACNLFVSLALDHDGGPCGRDYQRACSRSKPPVGLNVLFTAIGHCVGGDPLFRGHDEVVFKPLPIRKRDLIELMKAGRYRNVDRASFH